MDKKGNQGIGTPSGSVPLLSMEEALHAFPQQFAYKPEIMNDQPLKRLSFDRFVVAGMGGSALAAALLRAWRPDLDILVHRDIGLPFQDFSQPQERKPNLAERFLIASSYSGGTFETMSAFQQANVAGMFTAAVSTGGWLLTAAQQSGCPYVVLPNLGLHPRCATGHSIRALMRLMNLEDGLRESAQLVSLLDSRALCKAGARLASDVADSAARCASCVPLIYTSTPYEALGYVWKIKLNETGKIPAFSNVVPEANHNEICGFDPSATFSEYFCAIFLMAEDDSVFHQRAMEVMMDLYSEAGLPIHIVNVTGQNRLHRIFSSALLADWTAYHIALRNGSDPLNIPNIAEFKKRMQRC